MGWQDYVPTPDTTVVFVLTASNVTDLSSKTFIVTYNPNEVDLLDLCASTPNAELTTGSISGTDITVTQLSSGSITFTVNKEIPSGSTWSGVVIRIKFNNKIDGEPTIMYTVQ
jgi:hypothetical protein